MLPPKDLPRYATSLQNQIDNLDKEYDKLNEEFAKGENSKFDAAPSAQSFTVTSKFVLLQFVATILEVIIGL